MRLKASIEKALLFFVFVLHDWSAIPHIWRDRTCCRSVSTGEHHIELMTRSFSIDDRPARRVFQQVTQGHGVGQQDVINAPQLQANKIVVPLEGAGENLKLTVSSPIQMRGVAKVPAKRAPDLGEHNDEVLKELGFDAKEIERLRASGVIAKPTAPTATASKSSAVAA